MVNYYTKEDYAMAYVEVVEIINNFSKEDYNKVPNDLMEYIPDDQ